MPRRDSLNGRRRAEGGQVLVIFVLSLTALFAAAGLAIDIGRFYSERRFLENAADAAALGAASALVRGGDDAAARADARAVLTRNFSAPPNGITPSLPPAAGSEVYVSGHAGQPAYLIDGILINGGDIRVAVRNTIPYTFGRIVGLGDTTIVGRARVGLKGDLLPIAVRHYLNAPGPTSGAAAPCDGDSRDFQDLVATASTACLGSETNASPRQVPSAGSPYDPSIHGPIISLVGQGAQAANSSSFRGFIALDIRNFQSETSNVFYSGVTAGTTPSALKNLESGWARTGYTGPPFAPVTSPPDPNDQVAIMDGNSSGLVIAAIGDRYKAGDEILAAVYSGTVMTIPDFSYTVPGDVSIGPTQNRDGSISMSALKNAAFSGVVDTTAFADWGDPANPLKTGTMAPVTFSPSPATPKTTITWTTFSTTGAPVGIYTIWIMGHSSSPYLTDHYYPVAVNVGGVVRDFSSTSGGQVFATPTTGGTATGTMVFETPNKNETAFMGSVNLSIEGGPGSLGVLPAGIGPVSISPTVTLVKGSSETVTVSLGGGALAAGEYPLTIRATGTNADGQVVTRLIPIVFDIATAGTSNEYVDIMGFAVFRITSVNSNSVDGYAISGVYADMSDHNLRRGQVARLVPWN